MTRVCHSELAVGRESLPLSLSLCSQTISIYRPRISPTNVNLSNVSLQFLSCAWYLSNHHLQMKLAIAFKVVFPSRRYHRSGHSSTYSPSSSGSDTSDSWPFGVIKSTSSSLETEIMFCKKRKREATYKLPHMLLPNCIDWPTK